MKFISLALTALTFTLPAFAQAPTFLTYDTTYDNPDLSLASVACSNGVNGLLTKGYTTLGSLPAFPYVGGVYAVTGFDSPACGTCWEVTHGTTTIVVLAVDVAPDGFNVSEEAMNALTGGLAVDLGSVPVISRPADPSECGL